MRGAVGGNQDAARGARKWRFVQQWGHDEDQTSDQAVGGVDAADGRENGGAREHRAQKDATAARSARGRVGDDDVGGDVDVDMDMDGLRSR